MSDRNLAVVLAAIAGYADAVGYVTLHHLFTAHMTGNASKLGVALARGDVHAAVPLVLLPFAFLAGAAGGAVLVDARRTRALLAAESALVLAYMGLGRADARASFYALLALAALALGLQTAAIGKIDGVTIRTSYVTGVLTNLAQGAVRRLRGTDDRTPLLVLAAVWAAYVGGATLGAAVLHQIGWWSLALPGGALAAAAGGRSGTAAPSRSSLDRPTAPS